MFIQISKDMLSWTCSSVLPQALLAIWMLNEWLQSFGREWYETFWGLSGMFGENWGVLSLKAWPRTQKIHPPKQALYLTQRKWSLFPLPPRHSTELKHNKRYETSLKTTN